MSVSFCRACGAPLAAGTQFCDQCGADQRAATAKQEGSLKSLVSEIGRSVSEASAHASGSESVGTGVVRKCPNCGTEIDGEWYRCPRCGRQLRDDSPRITGQVTVSDIALGVFLGMVAFSAFSALIWFGFVMLILRES